VIDSFVEQRLTPLLDTSGPVWRWRSDSPLTAALNPATPEAFAKAREVRDLLSVGLPLRISLDQLGSEINAVVISSGGSAQRLQRGVQGARPIQWSTAGVQEAFIELVPAGAEGAAAAQPLRFEQEGPWALFRLIDQADRENAGESAIRVTFGEGARSATLLVSLPSPKNPFSRGGLWSFRCPTAL
jgi:type VI secretion system protein ImpL